MARAIVRFSFDGDYRNATRNRILLLLKAKGLVSPGTGSWEARDVPLTDITNALRDVLDVLDSPSNNARLGHVWIYVDQTDEKDPAPDAPGPPAESS